MHLLVSALCQFHHRSKLFMTHVNVCCFVSVLRSRSAGGQSSSSGGGKGRGLHIVVPSHDGHIYIIGTGVCHAVSVHSICDLVCPLNVLCVRQMLCMGVRRE